MNRPIAACWAATTLALSAVAVPAVANAEPPPPCNFTLSAPQVVQDGGVAKVTAILEPNPCGPPATTAKSVACIQPQGESATCMQSGESGGAQVFLPYRPGTTYVSTGRGCGGFEGFWWASAPLCQPLGPYNATL
jgi:hypothetical protein